MVRMWIVTGPHEFVLTNMLHGVGDRRLAGIPRDEALALKVKGRRFLQQHRRSHDSLFVHSVRTVKISSYPSRSTLQHYRPQLRKPVENSIGEHTEKCLLCCCAGKQQKIPIGPLHTIITVKHVPCWLF